VDFIFIFIISIFLRFFVIKHSKVTFDGYGHLYFANEIRKQKSGPFKGIKTKIVKGNILNAQFLWHWLISFIFNNYKLKKYRKYFNICLDSLFSVFIYYISTLAGLTNGSAILVSLVYLLTPMWFSSLSMGPRLNDITPRLSSEIAINIILIFTLIPLGINNYIIILIASLLTAFVLLSSKFGVQALIFILPLTSLISQQVEPLISLLGGILISLVISKGYFIKSITLQINHSIWYFKNNLKGKLPISERNRFYKISNHYSKNHSLKQNIMALTRPVFSRNSYLSVIFKMPVLITLSLFVLPLNIIDQAQINLIYMSPVYSAFIIYMIINFRYFLFLGEAERYLNHVAFFISFYFVLLCSNTDLVWIVYLLLIYGVVFMFYENYYNKNTITCLSDKYNIEDKIIKKLESYDNKLTILCYPYHAIGGTWRIMLDTQHSVIFGLTLKKDFSTYFEENYSDTYPFVNLNKIEEMRQELGVNCLIIENQTIKRKWSLPTTWIKLNIGKPYYSIYLYNDQSE